MPEGFPSSAAGSARCPSPKPKTQRGCGQGNLQSTSVVCPGGTHPALRSAQTEGTPQGRRSRAEAQTSWTTPSERTADLGRRKWKADPALPWGMNCTEAGGRPTGSPISRPSACKGGAHSPHPFRRGRALTPRSTSVREVPRARAAPHSRGPAFLPRCPKRVVVPLEKDATLPHRCPRYQQLNFRGRAR